MDSKITGVDFIAIGHQESWLNISAFVNSIRTPEQGKLSCEKIRNIFSFIPARELFKVKVRSKTGAEINGMYVESFIDPDKLCCQFARTNLSKVKNAILRSKKLGAKIVTLGGFTSIILEGNFDSFTTDETKFTTGNTLTAAYIVKGLERAAAKHHINLKESSILILGATGDIGRACSNYLKRIAGKLLLCARNKQRLKILAEELMHEDIRVHYSDNLQALLPEADVIICVASSTGIKLTASGKKVLVCDAGFPKNLERSIGNDRSIHLFHGGMGQVSCGYDFHPDYSESIYKYEAPFIFHGCILEAMVLAFENRYENYSSGKGNITVEKMEEIYGLSLKHGIDIAPFYNERGLW